MNLANIWLTKHGEFRRLMRAQLLPVYPYHKNVRKLTNLNRDGGLEISENWLPFINNRVNR